MTALVFLIAYFGSCFMAIARHPIFGIYAYMLAFYGYPPGRWWGASLPDLRWSLSASLVTMIAFYIHNSKMNKRDITVANNIWFGSLPVKVLFVFTIWLWIQNAWALLPDTHYTLSILFTKYIVMCFLFYRILDSDENIYHFCLSHVFGCAYFGWLAYTTASGGRFEGVGSPGVDDANALATHMATGLIMAGFLLLRASNKVRIALILAIPFILNCIIMTQSRGAMLGILCAGIAALFIKPKRYKKAFYGLAAIGMIGFLYLASETFLERMGSLQHAADNNIEAMDTSAQSRLVIIEAQYRMWMESPVLGHGHRGTVALSPFYLDKKWLTVGTEDNPGARASHNTFFTVLTEQGLPGALLYFVLVLWTIWTVLKIKGSESSGMSSNFIVYNALAGCSLACLLVAGQFADYLKHEVMIWLYVILLAIIRLSKNEATVEATASEENDEYQPGYRY